MSRNYYGDDTYHNYPDTIKVHEHKAPTDESVRLLNEMQDKALKNLVAKIEVTDNIVNGQVFCFEDFIGMDRYRVFFKFKINEQEFTIEKSISHSELWDADRDVLKFQIALRDRSKAIMLWYALKKFTQIAYEQLSGAKIPDEYIR